MSHAHSSLVYWGLVVGFFLGFYFFYTFCIISFLAMSGGLITGKNPTVIVKMLSVFSQDFQ